AEGYKFDSKKCKEVRVSKYNGNDPESSYFGDKEIVNNLTQELTIKVASHSLKCYALPAHIFKQIVKEIEKTDELQEKKTECKDASAITAVSRLEVQGGKEEEEDEEEEEKEEKEKEEEEIKVMNDETAEKDLEQSVPCNFRSGSTQLDKKFKNLVQCPLTELKHIGVLGAGAFGVVSLVEDPSTQKTYSLKKIRKNKVVDTGQERHIQNERRILACLDSDFCVRLYGTYQDMLNVYLLMEPILGGELFYLLRFNRRFEEPVARFYAGCVVSALEHIHSKNLIFRDLKPENLLLAPNGYCKLVDFGFAKELNELIKKLILIYMLVCNT
ncbi:hypothetical protein RFI_16771, partial [Reticulomyxa filosa]